MRNNLGFGFCSIEILQFVNSGRLLCLVVISNIPREVEMNELVVGKNTFSCFIVGRPMRIGDSVSITMQLREKFALERAFSIFNVMALWLRMAKADPKDNVICGTGVK